MEKRRWTKEDDKTLVNEVKVNFGNLREAFRKTSEKTGRTLGAVKARWYMVLTNPRSSHYIGSSCFLTFGTKAYYSNRKNDTIFTELKLPLVRRIWNKILDILGIK